MSDPRPTQTTVFVTPKIQVRSFIQEGRTVRFAYWHPGRHSPGDPSTHAWWLFTLGCLSRKPKKVNT